jgi:transcriptional regulator with XRE-family HTH domain
MILDLKQRVTLVRHRVRLRLSQEQLGARMGTTNTTVCKLEMGRIALSYQMLERWCKSLGLRPRIIFELDADTGEDGPTQYAAPTNGQAHAAQCAAAAPEADHPANLQVDPTGTPA